MPTKLKIFLFLVLLGSMGPQAVAFDEINTGFFDNVALDGYDAVSYFSKSEPVKGTAAYATTWRDTTWLFSSEKNRQKFKTTPDTYAPQYGGYCSNQMSLGNLSDIDPHVWTIFDEKLYLYGHDVGRKRWSRDTIIRIEEADQHWQKLTAK